MVGCSVLLIYGTFLPFILSAPAIILEFQSDCSLGRPLNSTPQLCHSKASASISSQVSFSLPESPTKPLHLRRPFWTTPSLLVPPVLPPWSSESRCDLCFSTQHVFSLAWSPLSSVILSPSSSEAAGFLVVLQVMNLVSRKFHENRGMSVISLSYNPNLLAQILTLRGHSINVFQVTGWLEVHMCTSH